MFSILANTGFALPSMSELGSALPVIVSLIVIEGLLSVDNALAIAAMANHLPEKQKRLALKLGIIGAYVFRGVALAFAAWILKTPWVMWCGAAYLIYLMCQHFTGAADENHDGKPDMAATRGLWGTIASIEIMDLSLSVDNVLAAAAMDRRLWVVCLGVFIGILALRFVAGWCLRLLEKYPVLEHTAFLLIGWVGFILVGELLWDVIYPLPLKADGSPSHHHIESWGKFAGILVIVVLCLAYQKYHCVRVTLKPLNQLARGPMWLVASLVGTLVNGIIWPFRRIIQSVRGRGNAAA
jgi:tellurite resistance protein TerC